MDGRRIRFTEDFSFKPEPRVTQVFKKGTVAFVTLACAEKAIAKGKAVATDLPAPPAGIAATIARTARKRAPRKRANAGNE
jgi:hypothetical protein